MLDVDSIKDQVLTDIGENLGFEDGDLGEDELNVIRQMSMQEAFDRFLIWNGIQGFTGTILEAVDSLQAAEVIADIRTAVSGEVDTNVAWYAIQELMLKHGHRDDETLKLVTMALANCLETKLRALALLKIRELICA